MFGRRRKAKEEPPRAPDPMRVVLAYHDATKHDFHRYAAAPDELDWATEPDPFRRFVGAPIVALEHVLPSDEPYYEPSFCEGQVAPARLDRRSLSQLFYDSLALSAWKRLGEARWSLRVDPSSGNLHPTESYLVCGAVPGVVERPSIAHYAPAEHGLEVRAQLPIEVWNELAQGQELVFVGLSSIHWREAWKYGERAFRYCQLDLGHVIGALAVAAAGLGWRAQLVEAPATLELAQMLGIAFQRGPEAERAEALLAIGPDPRALRSPPRSVFARCAALEFRGAANSLSTSHVDWAVIDAVADASERRSSEDVQASRSAALAPAWIPDSEPISLRRIVRQRRSAVSLDGRTGMTADAFFQTLRRTLARERSTVHGALPWDPCVDLVLFVHRVADVDPGLYVLLRDVRRIESWRAEANPQFEWAQIGGAPGELALYRLRSGDARSLARSVSCHQDIAADGCFAVAMVADFRAALERYGPWFYRRLHWECGFVGQLLYLEAEALGLRATGIGCFFDDADARALDLRNDRRRSLYHFTLGGAALDPRLQEEPAYPPHRPGE